VKCPGAREVDGRGQTEENAADGRMLRQLRGGERDEMYLISEGKSRQKKKKSLRKGKSGGKSTLMALFLRGGGGEREEPGGRQ